METLEQIQHPIKEDLVEFEKRMQRSVKSNVFLLDRITDFLISSKGKQMRPTFVLLMAKVCGGITERSYIGATLIELLHNATLVHDDVVDDAYQRRGLFSINALWKNKIAVLLGDYLLSRGLLLCVDNNELNLLKLVSQAVKEMSEGELLQLEKARKLDITEEVYFTVIRQKTASLIAACCAAGAESAGSDNNTVDLAWKLGETVGLAFQIKDDLFDYGVADVGKPTGIDIKEKKLTLPLIYALNNCSPSEKTRIKNLVRKHSNKAHKVKEVIDFVKKSGGLDYTKSVMDNYYKKSLEILYQFEPSEARNKMESLIAYVIDRKK